MTKSSDPFRDISEALAVEDQVPVSVRTAAGEDPLPGFPMDIRDAFGRVIAADVPPGKWLDHADRQTGLPPMCPVTPLGRAGDTYFFLNVDGEIDHLKASSSGKGPIGSLFAGRSRYLEWAWPRFGKARKGETAPVVGWEADDARQALMDACAYIGVFDDADRVRGRGAWKDDDGGLIYHAGDMVLFRGRWLAPGRHGEWVFPARPALPRPWPERVSDGSAGPGQELLDIFETWNWRRSEIDARLLLGWVAMSMLSGALDWRAAAFLTGEKGSGKSTLQAVVAGVHGRALVKSVNTTGPALYQRLKHDSTPVAIDELEAQAENGGGQRQGDQIIQLVRTASSGGTINRGSSEGISREYQCRSAFLLSAINIPAMRGQDQSRFAILALQPFPDPEPGVVPADPDFDTSRLELVGRQLLRRMIDGWPRWAATLKAFRHALMEAGHDPRGADQFGALLAAEHIARSDAMPDRGALGFWSEALAPSRLSETSHKIEDWRECLLHMLDVMPDQLKHRKGGTNSVGGALALYRESPDTAATDAEDVCASVGLALTWPKGELRTWWTARLFVPGSHPEVRKLFAGTTWQGLSGATGVWSSTLQRAPAEIIRAGVCGKGLDQKRWGVFVQLALAFPEGPGRAGGEG